MRVTLPLNSFYILHRAPSVSIRKSNLFTAYNQQKNISTSCLTPILKNDSGIDTAKSGCIYTAGTGKLTPIFYGVNIRQKGDTLPRLQISN